MRYRDFLSKLYSQKNEGSRSEAIPKKKSGGDSEIKFSYFKRNASKTLPLSSAVASGSVAGAVAGKWLSEAYKVDSHVQIWGGSTFWPGYDFHLWPWPK